MICPACGHANEVNANFCLKCGTRLIVVCPKCEKVLPPDAQFCSQCGTRIATRSPQGRAPQPPTPSLQPPGPTSFGDGRYEVKRFLGEGGKKRVYLAHDTKLDRDVAFALIKTDGLDEEGLLRIKREAQAMGRLGDHPHIVSVFDIGEENGQPYLVSQLMGGGDIEGLIEKAPEHRVPLAESLRIADEVCRALEHAHDQGIVHRDLKPGNVWLTADGTAKLGDFGLAVALDRTRLTQAGMMVGTVHYMPPEQAIGGEVTARSDLYSLGAMLYELVTGRPPFVGDESVAIITQHLNTPPVAPSWHVRDLPSGLEALILRLLEKDPGKRPASAGEVRTMLAGTRAPTPTPPPTLRQTQGRLLREGQTSDDGSPLPKLGEGQGVRANNPLYRRSFVGREEELRQLETAFDGALSGDGALLTVVGEPGIGKTAICEQLATYVAVRGGRTLVGHCYEEGSLSLPYLPFVEALRGYVLTRDPDGLRQDLGSGAQEVARIVSEIRDRVALSPGPSPNPSAGSGQAVGGGVGVGADPDEDRWRLYQAITDFLRNASGVQPLLIVVEDLHWADRGTLDLLTHLSRNLGGTRLVLVGTYRDVEVDRAHPLASALAELRRGSAFQRVVLRGLRAPEVQRMLAAISGEEIPWGLADAVHRQTEGNPLFIQEVARYLVEEGLLRRDASTGRAIDLSAVAMSIPEGLREVIGKRLSRLSPECNRLLAVAAVIGREFLLDTLRTVSPSTGSGQALLAEEALVVALEDAVHVGVLEEEARHGTVRYRYTHAFFRQTLYEELSAPRRIQLHQQVARALEAQYAARPDEHAAELAEHFSNSSDHADLAKAIAYSERAAQRALAVFAYGEAVRHLAQALEVQEVLDPTDDARRCDLLLALGTASGPAGEPQRAYEVLAPEALALAEGLGDQRRASQACQMAIDALVRYGGAAVWGTPTYHAWAERADHYAPPEGADRARADSANARSARGAGDYARSRELNHRALEAARRLGDPETLFFVAGGVLGAGDWLPGDFALYADLARESVGRSAAGVSTSSLTTVLRFGFQWLLTAGDRNAAEAALQRCRELADRSRDPRPLAATIACETQLATLDGEFSRALATGERLIAHGEDSGSRVATRSEAVRGSALLLVYLGRAGESVRAFDELFELAGDTRERDVIRRALSSAYSTRNAEELGALRTLLAEGIAAVGRGQGTAELLCRLLEAAIVLSDGEAAAALIPPLATLAAVAQCRSSDIEAVGRLLGDGAVLMGDRKAALAYYQTALEATTRIRHRPEAALTHLALAELLLGDGALTPTLSQREREQTRAEAQSHLDLAIEEFRSMKMQPFLERALRHKRLLHA